MSIVSPSTKSFAKVRLSRIEGKREVLIECIESVFAEKGQSWDQKLAHGGHAVIRTVSEVRLNSAAKAERYPYGMKPVPVKTSGDSYLWKAARAIKVATFGFELVVDRENIDPYSASQIVTDVLVSDQVGVTCAL